MRNYLWPGDTGWPTPEGDEEAPLDVADLDAEFDLDAIALHAPPPHLFDGLTPTERIVLGARFGLGGQPVLSMKQLQARLDLPRQELRDALASGLEKLRTKLAS